MSVVRSTPPARALSAGVIALALGTLMCGDGLPWLNTHDAPLGDYEVSAEWPVLPQGYVLGEVTGVAVDSKDRVFIFHRADKQWDNDSVITLPTVLVMDGDSGEVIATWGANLFKVPHGLSIDAEDNVWLTDVKLNRVYKFSPEGQLLLQVGEDS
ncbi:hypothetical protein NVS55_34660 [Myxococcus stipitatus]|uniref:hypothetical protein n=1 Tax=Myxococcus stipitatus TaxID=83455 RepID=UPI0031456909